MLIIFGQANPCSAPDQEWLKIVASTFIGVIAGLMADPIRTWLTTRNTRKQIEQSIKFDCLTILTSYRAIKAGVGNPDNFWAFLEIPTFEHHWAENRASFYGSMYMQIIRLKCQNILTLRKCVTTGSETSEKGMADIEPLVISILELKEATRWEKFRNRIGWRKSQRSRAKSEGTSQ
jgi:hypothetical protein